MIYTVGKDIRTYKECYVKLYTNTKAHHTFIKVLFIRKEDKRYYIGETYLHGPVILELFENKLEPYKTAEWNKLDITAEELARVCYREKFNLSSNKERRTLVKMTYDCIKYNGSDKEYFGTGIKTPVERFIKGEKVTHVV